MKVISLEQGRARLHTVLEEEARLAFIARDFPRALRAARRALRHRSGCWQAQVLHGDILCALGRPGEALSSYHRARRLAPEIAEPYWSISTVHVMRGHWACALRYLELAQRRLSRGDGLLFEWIPEDRALALLRLGRRREALAAVRWGLERKPDGERL